MSFHSIAQAEPKLRASQNAAPTDQLPIVRLDPRAAERSLDLVHWGRVPFWAKDINVGFANFNAKTEGIETRPAFRDAFQRRRYLVPVDNFCEWKKTATGKQPYAVALADRKLMALAPEGPVWGPHPSCGDCPLTARSRPKRAAKISRKIIAGPQ